MGILSLAVFIRGQGNHIRWQQYSGSARPTSWSANSSLYPDAFQDEVWHVFRIFLSGPQRQVPVVIGAFPHAKWPLRFRGRHLEAMSVDMPVDGAPVRFRQPAVGLRARLGTDRKVLAAYPDDSSHQLSSRHR